MGDHHTIRRRLALPVAMVAAMTVGGMFPLGGTAAAATPPVAVTLRSPADRAVEVALAQQGVPYVWGGTTPRGFDCSGLVQWSYRQAGITLPRTSRDQAKTGVSVTLSQLRRGDLLFYAHGGKVTHVAIAVGGGTVVEASQPGQPVAKRRLYTAGLVAVRRVG